ncbi:MAG: glycosyl hydrolase [Planctomycetota bacterium]|jgi:hypothetical protein
MHTKNHVHGAIVVALIISLFGVDDQAQADYPLHDTELWKQSPYMQTSKPYTRWWWFASDMEKDDIKAQLDWAKANHFGGVEIAWVYPLDIERFARENTHLTDADRAKIARRPKWLSPEWSELVEYAKRYADKIGLGCDFTFGSLWPFGDSLVAREDATRVFGDENKIQEIRYSWDHPTLGRVINHLDRKAFERYAQRTGQAMSPALQGNTSALFCDSWEVETRRIWTAGFGEAFQARFGYDIRPHMADIYATDAAASRYDYMKLVSELVIGEFYVPFTATCHELEALSRAQCSGAPCDILTAYAALDIPESEALLYEPNYSQIVASAAALASRPLVTCETFTCLYGWPNEHHRKEQTSDLKLVADAVMANGVNHVIWHGMPFNRKGDDRNSFYASVHVGSTGSLAEEIPEFNRYLEKVCHYMRQGRVYSDVAVYLPLEDSWIAGEYPEELQMKWSWGAYELRYVWFPEELHGYRPLWINGHFLENAKLINGRLQCGDASFNSLYVDVEHMDIASLERIVALGRQGFPICLKRQPKEPGRSKTARYSELLEALQRMDNVSADFARVRVNDPLMSGDDLPDHWCRVLDDGTHYIFFANPKARNLKLPLSYGQSLMEEDITVPVTITVNGVSRRRELKFAPHQSLLMSVSREREPRMIDIAFHPKRPTRNLP